MQSQNYPQSLRTPACENLVGGECGLRVREVKGIKNTGAVGTKLIADILRLKGEPGKGKPLLPPLAFLCCCFFFSSSEFVVGRIKADTFIPCMHELIYHKIQD